MATTTDERTRRRLRDLREREGLSLDEIGRRAGMAASTVSRLESGARRLALDHLPPLAHALGVTVDELLAPPEPVEPRVHGRPFTRSGITFLPLSRGGAGSSLRFFRVSYPERAAGPGPTDLKVHEGHDWFYVLHGRLRLVLGEEDFLLDAGEAAEFSCRTPHWLGAVDGPAEVLAVFGPHGEHAHAH